MSSPADHPSTDNLRRPVTDPQNPFAAPQAGTPAGWGEPQLMQAQGQPLPAEMIHQTGDGTGGLIPYKNPKALISYYLGIVSLLPVLGFPFGIASIFLGIGGLRARNRNPIIKGSVHAIIGIVLGICGMPLHLLFGVGLVIALVQALSGGP